MLGGGASGEEAVGHPDFLGLAFGAFGVHRLGEAGRDLGKGVSHIFEAHGRVGVVKPVVGPVGFLNGHDEMLVFAELAQEGARGRSTPFS